MVGKLGVWLVEGKGENGKRSSRNGKGRQRGEDEDDLPPKELGNIFIHSVPKITLFL